MEMMKADHDDTGETFLKTVVNVHDWTTPFVNVLAQVLLTQRQLNASKEISPFDI